MTITAPTVAPSEQSRWRRMVPPVALVGGLASASLALNLRDPHSKGSWGICPLAALGISCPGCGGLRAVNDLTHFDIAGAASSNLLFVASLPVIVWLFWRWSASRWAGRDWTLQASGTTQAIWIAGAGLATLAFTVARNTGWGAWLAP